MDDLENDLDELTSGPWRYDPAEQAWFAKTGPDTWEVWASGPDDPPEHDPKS